MHLWFYSEVACTLHNICLMKDDEFEESFELEEEVNNFQDIGSRDTNAAMKRDTIRDNLVWLFGNLFSVKFWHWHCKSFNSCWNNTLFFTRFCNCAFIVVLYILTKLRNRWTNKKNNNNNNKNSVNEQLLCVHSVELFIHLL